MPLRNIRVIELAGLAPAPFCGMVLADFGASVIRVDKTSPSMESDCLGHGKKSIALNLKTENGVNIFKRFSNNCDVIIDPFRRGVMEKLKLGPEDLMRDNKRLIYARLTGFGQNGPYADMAGHDINFLSLSGLLSLFGRSNQKPTPPVNLAADFGGGGLMCALGIIMALYERTNSQKGQVIDSSMVEGSAYLGSWLFRSQNLPGLWGNPRGHNLLDSGAHFYDTYKTKDNEYMAIGALEPQFYNTLLKKLNLTDDDLPQFGDMESNRKKLEDIFETKTQKEWMGVFDGTDACVTPVLNLQNVNTNSHNKARNVFVLDKKGESVPNVAPKLSRTPGRSKATEFLNPKIGEHTVDILKEFSFEDDEISEFLKHGIVKQYKKSKL